VSTSRFTVFLVAYLEEGEQVGRLDQALILLGLTLYLPCTSVSSLFIVLYAFKVTFFTLRFRELSLVGLALYLVD